MKNTKNTKNKIDKIKSLQDRCKNLMYESENLCADCRKMAHELNLDSDTNALICRASDYIHIGKDCLYNGLGVLHGAERKYYDNRRT